MNSTHSTTVSSHPEWDQQIPASEWAVYAGVIQQARAAGIRFAFGGGFALAAYTGEFRNTKDFDFYVLPQDQEAMKSVIARSGLTDYFDRLAYDRSWIYRASRDDVIVDVIWAMANHRADVDERWLSHGPEVTIRNERMRVIPIEELIWSKLYVLQRERCDWGDVFKLIYAQAHSLEWKHLLDRLADDAPLLGGALSVFGWLAPNRAAAIPHEVWARLGIRRPDAGHAEDVSRARADLLDSRPWFRWNDR